MWIHTVEAGDSLREIARIYGTTTRELLRLNELDNEEILVNGLHLLVPGEQPTLAQAYTVRPNETLASIARKLGVSERDLRRFTGQQTTAAGTLTAGTVLYVPKPITQKRTIDVNAFQLPEGKPSDENVLQDVRNLTYLSVFSYNVRADGTIAGPNDRILLLAANRLNMTPLLTVTNFDGRQFNAELAHTIMANGSIRRRLTETIIRTSRSRGYEGINLDFEHLRPSDRDLYIQFVRQLADNAKAQGLITAITLAPKTGTASSDTSMDAIDYKALSAEVEMVMLVTYHWGWVGGPPMTTIALHVFNGFRQ